MKNKQLIFAMAALLSVAIYGSSWAASSCPDKKTVAEIIQKTFRRTITVEKVRASKVKGLCEAVVNLNGQKRLLYTDEKGEYIINGQIFSVANRTNITRESIAELNKFTPAQLKTLDNLVAFEKGAGKTLYFVTDPMCPYCKKAERILEPLMEEGKIKVKFLLFPLRFHKGAKEQCISIICDKKGLEGLKTQYRSENQCDAGKRQVEDTVKFLQQKGITGTPTYIFMDGRYHSGVLQKDALLKRLGVK